MLYNSHKVLDKSAKASSIKALKARAAVAEELLPAAEEVWQQPWMRGCSTGLSGELLSSEFVQYKEAKQNKKGQYSQYGESEEGWGC